MDKFLEYCTRETVRIEWNDEAKRLQCAKFILDRVIVLYIYEVFPDIETSGVDIYGGWESSEEHIDIRDTADPIVIARYWLIRFVLQSTLVIQLILISLSLSLSLSSLF